MRIRGNLGVLSHNRALKDASGCHQQLVGWVAMERLRQLGGLHYDSRVQVQKGHTGFRESGRDVYAAGDRVGKPTRSKCGCPAGSPESVPILARDGFQGLMVFEDRISESSVPRGRAFRNYQDLNRLAGFKWQALQKEFAMFADFRLSPVCLHAPSIEDLAALLLSLQGACRGDSCPLRPDVRCRQLIACQPFCGKAEAGRRHRRGKGASELEDRRGSCRSLP